MLALSAVLARVGTLKYLQYEQCRGQPEMHCRALSILTAFWVQALPVVSAVDTIDSVALLAVFALSAQSAVLAVSTMAAVDAVGMLGYVGSQ